MNQTTEIYRRIRNSLFRFCLANLDDFDFTRNKSTAFEEEDIYVLNILDKNIKAINEYYKQYNFMAIIKTVNNFVIDLSSWYFNLIKDCLYCDDKDNVHRRAIQTVIYYILKSHLVLLQPIMPHTTSEAYQFFNTDAKKQDIFFEN
ncbi:class I tRNA ligase family protein [bacterium]|nr:class I tRNA ligase family protein [bacterium]